MAKAWAHLHLPRLRAGVSDVISLKIPGEPIRYVTACGLTGVEFKVSEPGRLRCVRENVRNVHAWVVGDLVSATTEPWVARDTDVMSRAIYDPFKGPTFVDALTLRPITHADAAILVGKHVYYLKGMA